MPGALINGTWKTKDFETKDGRFTRQDSVFRNWITADGKPGPTGEGGFPAAAGRYHLYVSYACPWAHRTLIMRHLKNLEDAIDVSVVDPHMGDNGWSFTGPKGERTPGATGDKLYESKYLHQLYTRAAPTYTGRATVPVLWDKERNTIVSNESADIIRMLNGPMAACASAPSQDFYPTDKHAEIDRINAEVYPNVNNGVYRCGFATTQEAYNEAFNALFKTLDALEARLVTQRYLAGDALTEADVRLVTTLLRFDAVYYVHFKCNRTALREFPSLWRFTRDMYNLPGIASTVYMHHIKQHYYWSHTHINPSRIVPLGPAISFS